MPNTRAGLVFWTNLVLVGLAGSAFAQTPGPSDVCVSDNHGHQIVDKEKLAHFFWAKNPFDISAIPPGLLAATPFNRLQSTLLASTKLCDNNKACSDSDKASLDNAQGAARVFLSDLPGDYAKPTDDVAEDYFRGANEVDEIRCLSTAAGAQYVDAAPSGPGAEKTPSLANLLSPLRVRGVADDLGVQRSDAAPFKGASAASFSYLRDSVAKTNTYKLKAVLGWAVHDNTLGTGVGWQFVPYVGLNKTAVTNFTGVSKPASTDTVDVGLYFKDYLRAGRVLGVPLDLSARPDYLWDHTDSSELFTFNGRATPFISGYVNDYDLLDFKPFAVEGVADVRLDVGRYTRAGINAIALAAPTFVRLGGQFGVNIVSMRDDLPLSLSATYTALHAFQGAPNIGYLDTALTWSFDTHKYVGLSVSYVDGTKEDTGKREQQLNLSLSVKY